MPPVELFMGFVLASAALIAVPGPNVALIVSHSVAHGTRYGLLTVAATTAAQVLPLLLVVLGTSALLATFAEWFAYLRWIGVAYLIVLGITMWRAPPTEAKTAAPIGRRVMVRGFLVAITNPKTLLFYGAFLPQFVSADRPVLPQLALLSLTFLLVAFIGDSLWAIAAGRSRRLLAHSWRIHNRISGALLVTAGIGLAFARKS
jgi:threonine/homoserine/homoserine lactone efflux protein